MIRQRARRAPRALGGANPLYLLALVSVALVVGLVLVLMMGPGRGGTSPGSSAGGSGGTAGGTSGGGGELFMYCAAGMRYPVEQIAADYEREYGVSVQLQYGGSNTLLSQLEVSKTGDLYLAGDDSYIKMAHDKGLLDEAIPLAHMRPVIAVPKANPKNIKGVADLLRPDVKVALGNPDAAAIGKKTRKLLTASGQWKALEQHATDTGVFKPTVNDVANDVKLGSVDAGIIWDSTVAQYPELASIRAPELDAGEALIEVGVLRSTKNATAALRFARYLGARDKGLKVFKKMGWEPVDGDVWAESPQVTFFVGSVNRRALEPIINAFERREGMSINTVYNGCGILTAQMRTMRQNQQSGFPDAYMACDVYYLNTVREWFQDAVNVSDTDIVIVTQKGNPKHIQTLADLARPGVRLAVGQPQQCTIGVLTRRMLEAEGLYEKLMKDNVVTQTATSALLVPAVTTGSADAVLAYRTDTLAEHDRLEVIPVNSPLSQAVQPYSIARSSDFKYLGRRLFDAIARSKGAFDAAGFHWRLNDDGSPAPAKAPAPPPEVATP